MSAKIAACIFATLVAVFAIFLALQNPSPPTSELNNGPDQARAPPASGLFDGGDDGVRAPGPESAAGQGFGAPPFDAPAGSPGEGSRGAASATPQLQMDFYRDSCPQAERIVKTNIQKIYAKQPDIAPGLLRLFFHDCFIMGCDASVLLDDSNGNSSHLIERRAGPNLSLRGFDEVELIKEELENACPGVVSCADTLALATRDAILLTGGPFYPVFTGRRDSLHSYPAVAVAEIPKPDGNISETIRLFSSRGFDVRETVSLLGGHNIGEISCAFAKRRLSNFRGTGNPDPTLGADFEEELRQTCVTKNNSAILLGSALDNHYYKSLLAGRGVLFADQQLTEDKRTKAKVEDFAGDDGRRFRRDFARAMVKMSMLNVSTGNEGEVRINCSLPLQNS